MLRRRFRPNHENVRSTTHRPGRTTKPSMSPPRLTIWMRGCGSARKDSVRGAASPDTEPDHPASQPCAGDRGGPRGRSDPVRWFASIPRGHYGYFGMPHNWPALNAFLCQIRRIWLVRLRRRSQKSRRWARLRAPDGPLPPTGASDHSRWTRRAA